MDYRSVELLKLVHTDFRAWALFPHVLGRVVRFIDKYNTESNKPYVVQRLSSAFALGDETVALWAINSRDVGLLGHYVLFIEQNRTTMEKFAFVLQIETDVAMPRRFFADGMAAAREWAITQGATYFELSTPLPERLWARLGFQTYRHVMRRPV